MEIESAMLLDWVCTYLAENHKIMEQISKESTTFDDLPITLKDSNYDKMIKN